MDLAWEQAEVGYPEQAQALSLGKANRLRGQQGPLFPLPTYLPPDNVEINDTENTGNSMLTIIITAIFVNIRSLSSLTCASYQFIAS